MTQTPRSVRDRHLMRVPSHGLQIETSSYDDRIRAHCYNSTASEVEDLRGVSATYLHLLPHMTPRLHVLQTPDFGLSDPSSPPHHNESNHLSLPTYSPYSPAGSKPSDGIPTDSRDLGFPQPSDTYDPWGSFYPPLNLLPDAAYSALLPTLHHSTLDLTLYSDFPCQQPSWSAENIQATCVDEYLPAPGHSHAPAPLPHNSGASLHPDVQHALRSYNETLSASCPCLWTEGGVTCNVMVQVIRSHMNRHLHAHHGFGGSDTRQTKCHWATCGETMQQGSIARHVVTCHLQAKVTCPMCSKKLSRQDVISKHQRVCPAASASSWR